MMSIQRLRNEVSTELDRIAAFWNTLRDRRGGFYGGVEYDLTIRQDADKGVVLNSRILWFYSNLYLLRGQQSAFTQADHAYEFLAKHCLDRENGGLYWMLDAQGGIIDAQKNSYNQAFGVYALSSYCDASNNKQALVYAMELYRLIEGRCKDANGYGESFDREWSPMADTPLSEDGYRAKKTMNTLLHIIEAYTELYRVSLDGEVADSLKAALRLCIDKVYDRQNRMLLVFFDEGMNSIADIYSYGHDIEATWLLDRACEVLGDEKLTREIADMNREIAAHVRQEAFDGKALCNQRLRGEVDTLRVWWVQAEGVVGFLNAYRRTKDKAYLDTALILWDYIKKHIADLRPGGEWFWCVDVTGKPIENRPIVEPWKCPYHNGRMCMEVIRRCEGL